KKTLAPNHAKLYLFENKEDFSQGGEYPGTLITGSSNLSRAGLKGQHEINVVFRNKAYFKEGMGIFDELWEKAVVIADKDNFNIFHDEVIKHIWYEKLPSPYLMYVRVLLEYFKTEDKRKIDLPHEITEGKYMNLVYQTDAVKLALSILEKHNGVVVSDVVGLGKSIIASAIAYNLRLKTLVIAPPHLRDQWEDYSYLFNLQAKIYSSGLIEEALKNEVNDEADLIIVDEAHKYRNPDSADYGHLHQLCADKKVILLTATPFNNRPQDIFSMISLFQVPKKSTIRTVDNLSYKFHEFIKEYRAVEKAQRDKTSGKEEIKRKVGDISKRIRAMLNPVVIRRSRLDLREIKTYRDDLKIQKIEFPIVEPPKLLDYNLGKLSTLYKETLKTIAPEDKLKGFQGVRYKPTAYLKDKYKSQWAQKLNVDKNLLGQIQTNLAKFMKWMLVRRFESSIFAFEKSLSSIIKSSEFVKDYYEKLGLVPIYKKGKLPNAEELLEMAGEDLDEEFADINFGRLKGIASDTLSGFRRNLPREGGAAPAIGLEELLSKQLEKGLHLIDKNELKPNFIDDLKKDIELLKGIQKNWFSKGFPRDSKLEEFKSLLKEKLEKEPKRKIIVFTEFSDTANYIYKNVKNSFKAFKYSSEDASKNNKKIIKENFDAGSGAQKNDYDILIATDAISEGVNLHRAGIIFNYDIPFNPTRVIQRVGRINRINKKVFDRLFIYNYFPTDIGESHSRIKEISTLKMDMVHALMGEDTKFLTSEEQLNSYYKEQYDELFNDEEKSWDDEYINLIDSLKSSKPDIIKAALEIPKRTRIKRTVVQTAGALVFAQKGGEYIFKFGKTKDNIGSDASIGAMNDQYQTLSPEKALEIFSAEETEKASAVTDKFNDIYQEIKKNLFNKAPKPYYSKIKSEAAEKLKLMISKAPEKKDYLEDLITVIEKLDSLPERYLKLIKNIDFDKLEKELPRMEKEISSKYLMNLLEKADKIDEGEESLILAEEF
ncbi:MAG: SNF2-related protein, partial [Elusimicrobia bacterium]|nr:SNF2-related protein [Elusimicrobiota bacterium]